MEVYVDDLVVKSKEPKQHIPDLQEASDVLQWYKLKLNPIRCAFGVGLEKFQAFMVLERGIETNPKKI